MSFRPHPHPHPDPHSRAIRGEHVHVFHPLFFGFCHARFKSPVAPTAMRIDVLTSFTPLKHDCAPKHQIIFAMLIRLELDGVVVGSGADLGGERASEPNCMRLTGLCEEA